MVFQTEPHIQRARAHIESNDADRLAYACLELRYVLERIVYQKLQLRLDKIAIEEIGAWQPRRAMDRLMELVDEHLNRDSILRVAPEKQLGEAATDGFSTLGQTKGVSPREIGKHWQKLGASLHIHMPKKKGDRATDPDNDALRAYLGEVITYVEGLTSTHFDSHFAQTVTFRCGKCNQSVVRNSELLKEQSIVQCQNSQCTASYITHAADGKFSFEPYRVTLDCNRCGEVAGMDANVFLQMKTDESKIFICDKCEQRHVVHWLLQYGLEVEKSGDGE